MRKFIPSISPGQKHPSERYEIGNADNMFLKLAKIIRVDYESNVVDIAYLDSIGSAIKIPITAAYAGHRSFMGGMPTVGDWVIVGFAKSGTFQVPYIVQYFVRGYGLGISNDTLKIPDSFVVIEEQDSVRFKMQKLYEGEIYSSSKYGSEIFLDRNVSISNSKLNELLLKSTDQSINLTSLNTYINSCGIRLRSGIIVRNELLENPEYKTNTGESKFPVYYSEDGVPYYAPVYSGPINKEFPYGKSTIDDDKPAFIEYRVEVKETSDPILPVTISNSGVEVDALYKSKPNGDSIKPLVVQVIGTLIGNDPVGEKKNYGVILRPKLFDNKVSFVPKMSEVGCMSDSGIDETTTLASAYSLKFPNSGTAFYVNKQGKIFVNVSASTPVDPMGGGDSAEISFAGHSKIFLGKNTVDQRSLSMLTDGGVFTNFGYDAIKSRSWDATFRKGVYWNILGNDSDNNSLNMAITGNEKRTLTGSRFTEIRGDDIRLVYGTIEDRVFGRKVDNFISDKSTNYGGNYTETALGAITQTLSSGRSIKILGPNLAAGSTVADKLDIDTGNSEFNMKLGNRTESILAGNFDTKMVAGNRTIDITAGNYTVKIGAGDIDIKTTAGSINVKTIAGNVTIKGSLGVKIESAVKVELSAPQVKIGSLPQMGVVTEQFPCYITGGVHLGSKSVTCNAV